MTSKGPFQPKPFYDSMVKHWNRMPREVVDVPYLQTFNVRLDGALRNRV